MTLVVSCWVLLSVIGQSPTGLCHCHEAEELTKDAWPQQALVWAAEGRTPGHCLCLRCWKSCSRELALEHQTRLRSCTSRWQL